jgi:hypothetical protein
VARLTYAALALALGALVSGFFIRTTAVPLFASIGLSALVLLLILRGWARRLREESPDLDELPEFDEVEEVEAAEPLDATDIVVVDAAEVSGEQPAVAAKAARRTTPRAPRQPRARPRPVRTPPARTTRGRTRRVVVLPGRTRYHIPGCRFAHGKGAEEISEATARRRRFQPCSVCLGA